MKTYKVTAQPDRNASATEQISEGSFSGLAFEWNNALLVAARKLWGEHPIEPQAEHR